MSKLADSTRRAYTTGYPVRSHRDWACGPVARAGASLGQFAGFGQVGKRPS